MKWNNRTLNILLIITLLLFISFNLTSCCCCSERGNKLLDEYINDRLTAYLTKLALQKSLDDKRNTISNTDATDIAKLFYTSIEKGDTETMLALLPVEKVEEFIKKCEELKSGENCKIDIIASLKSGEAKLVENNDFDVIFIYVFASSMVKNRQGNFKFRDLKMKTENISDTKVQVNLTYTFISENNGNEYKYYDNNNTVVLKKMRDKWYIIDIIDNTNKK